MNDRFERRSRFDNNDRQDFAPPVNVGDELDLKIEAVGEKGDGVAKKDGFVLFIPNVKEGDYVRVKVTKVLRKVGFAEVCGDAKQPERQQTRDQPRQQKQAEPEEEFNPSEDDSEDFGEETESEDDETDK